MADPGPPPAFPNTWGCSPSNRAIDAYFTKSDPGTYWDPGTAENLHLMLGYDPMGNLMSWGRWTETEAEPHTPVNTTQLEGLTAGFPADLFLPVTVSENQDSRLYQQYYFQSGNDPACLNNGSDGMFQPAKSYNVGSSGFDTAIAVGDFNGDGKPDLAVMSNDNIDVALGNGDGTFQSGNSYPTGLTLDAIVGSSLTFHWFSNFSNSSQHVSNYSSYYTVDSDSCGSTGGGQPNPWVINSANGPNGNVAAQVAPCQAGGHYTLYLVTTDNLGNQYTAVTTVYVPANGTPSPSLTVNSGTSISASVGGSLNFAWDDPSGLGTSATSTYFVDSAYALGSAYGDDCGDSPYPVEYPWAANSLSGGAGAQVANCQAYEPEPAPPATDSGHVYSMNYQVSNGNAGLQSTSTVTVYVNPAVPVTAQLGVTDQTTKASCNQNNCQITASPGDTLEFTWGPATGDSLGFFAATSYFTVDSTDACGFAGYPVQNSWVAYSFSSPAQGYIGTIAACQAGHTYTITYRVYGPNGSAASSAVQVQVNRTTLTPWHA